ncbi:MAG: hypothetical protein FWC68_03735, partial [Oscillospiraceae bacterium]|nr:hypothetical protein [Oscillospiraceae bacterium]
DRRQRRYGQRYGQRYGKRRGKMGGRCLKMNKSFRDSIKVENVSAIGIPDYAKKKKNGTGTSGGASAGLGVPTVTSEAMQDMGDGR